MTPRRDATPALTFEAQTNSDLALGECLLLSLIDGIAAVYFLADLKFVIYAFLRFSGYNLGRFRFGLGRPNRNIGRSGPDRTETAQTEPKSPRPNRKLLVHSNTQGTCMGYLHKKFEANWTISDWNTADLLFSTPLYSPPSPTLLTPPPPQKPHVSQVHLYRLEAITFDCGEIKRWKLDQTKGFVSLFKMSQKKCFRLKKVCERLITS